MKKALYFIAILIMLLSLSIPAFATTYNASSPVYVTSSTPNSTVTQSEILWGVVVTHSATITSATVKLQVQAGDQVSVNWCDSNGTTISTSSVDTSSSSANLSPPANAYGASIVLTSGSASGSRWAWWSTVISSNGDTTIFPDPNTSSSGGGGGTTVDLTPVVSALQAIQGQLTTMQGQLDTIIQNGSSSGSGGTGSLSDVVSAIQTETSTLDGDFNSIGGQLSSIIGQGSTVIGQLNTLNSTVSDIDSYLTIPRTSQPMTVNLPNITFDPTPPPITEPPQQPYKYDKPKPVMPPFVDSPGPLPMSPDPKVMPHDPAANTDPPIQKDQPRSPDPATMESPRQPDPNRRDQPATPDPVTRDTPRTKDNPLSIDSPIQRDQPQGRDNPITPDPPLTPDPPR